MRRKPNISLRYVPNGMVRRVWMPESERWLWEVFDTDGKRLPFRAVTLKEAIERLKEGND